MEQPATATEQDQPLPPKKKSRFTQFLVGLFFLLAVIAASLWYAVHQAQQLPSFYAEVLDVDMDRAQADGEQFERNLGKLRNTAAFTRPWIVEITQDQANGWLASDLPAKFPDALPVDIKEPRTVFTQDEIKVAFRYIVEGFEGIVAISANVFCTENHNEIAIQITQVKSGIIPLPVGPWLEQIADSITIAGIPVFFENTGENPIALFTLPEYMGKNATREVVIEAIDIRPGRLVFAGRTIRISDVGKTNQNKK